MQGAEAPDQSDTGDGCGIISADRTRNAGDRLGLSERLTGNAAAVPHNLAEPLIGLRMVLDCLLSPPNFAAARALAVVRRREPSQQQDDKPCLPYGLLAMQRLAATYHARQALKDRE